MTALEAIPKISELLARLIKLSKDRETGALVQQIQEHQLVIHAALVEADAKRRDLERELHELQSEEKRIHSAIEFRRGKRTGGVWMPFCPHCHMPAVADDDQQVACSMGCPWACGVPWGELARITSVL
jgi:hypothetical protein